MDQSARARADLAIADFWGVRASQLASAQSLQGGTRSAVTGGQHLNAVRDLLAEEFRIAGFPATSVHASGRAKSLPGYFRPTKNWDLAVTTGVDIVALIELKSQVGSFGNNANNRAEESLGNPVDLDAAFGHGMLGPRRPWVGYVYVIEDCPATTRPVRETKTFYPQDQTFDQASYLDRFAILGERVVEQGTYDAAWIIATTSPSSPTGATWRDASPAVGYDRFIQSVARLRSGQATPGPHVVLTNPPYSTGTAPQAPPPSAQLPPALRPQGLF